MSNLDSYKKLIKKSFKSKQIKTHVPTPTELDYQRGYINRFFCRKTNNISAPILEVNSDVFFSVAPNPEYRTVSIRWRISGKTEEIIHSNTNSIKIGSEIINNLKLYLPNLLQFHK